MFRSGFVGLVGRPNVGKSTLLNRLVGQKVAITSHVPQTTRHRIKGVVTIPNTGQIVLLDTPGFSKPLDELGNFLNAEGNAALNEADAFMVVVDLNQMAGKGDAWVLEQVKATGKFIFLVLNKLDQVGKDEKKKARHRKSYLDLMEGYPTFQSVMVSARTGKQCNQITKHLLRQLPEGPAYYDEDALTDQRLREMSAEIIREKVMRLMQDELPHSVAVMIDKFDESNPERTRIEATLVVDQDSQKGMVIGKGGQMIKTIGTDARKDIETLIGGDCFLGLNVVVKKNWRKDPKFLKQLGWASEMIKTGN